MIGDKKSEIALAWNMNHLVFQKDISWSGFFLLLVVFTGLVSGVYCGFVT